MHPRNIYKDSTRAIGHAEKDPYVAQFLIQEKDKKRFGSLDDKALRQLSTLLLKEDFNLNIDLPPFGLVPTIPLRLNYILWLEDLMNDFAPCSHRKSVTGASEALLTKSDGRIRGIDIGTGGSAIYAVLAARKNDWLMVGTETNSESFEYARKNVEMNNLENNVTVLNANPWNYFDQVWAAQPGITFDFSMCNPPFFGSPEEAESILNSRTEHRPPPPNEKTGIGNELFVDGGEIKFISDMITQSLKLKTRVRIFTSMVGVKAHLPIFVKLLKQHHVPNATVTEFIQGRTRRWGLAWSFYHNHKISHRNSIPGKLSNIWISGVPCPPKPIQAEVSMENELIDLQVVIKTMFNDLKLQLVHCKEDKCAYNVAVELEYVGFENNWSNMRRRRREQARASQQKTEPGEEASRSPKQIKTIEGCVEGQNASQESTGSQSVEQRSKGSVNLYELCDCDLGLVHFNIILRSRSPTATDVTFVHIEGALGPEGMHQVFQYMKNNLQKHEKVKNVVLSH